MPGSFGSPQKNGRATLDAETEEDAVALMQPVLRAYSETDMRDATVAYVDYVSEDGTIAVGPTDVGFNGTPTLGQIRDHYGVQDLSDGPHDGPTGESFRPLWGGVI